MPRGSVGNEPWRVSGGGCGKNLSPPRRFVPHLRPSQRLVFTHIFTIAYRSYCALTSFVSHNLYFTSISPILDLSLTAREMLSYPVLREGIDVEQKW